MPVEVFEDFAVPAGRLRETYEFRSSWLASSLRAMRVREMLDDYRAHLPPRYHAPIFESVAGHWLPVEVAVAHYAAVDALNIPSRTAYEMGKEIQAFSHSALIGLAVRVAKTAGATPWTLFAQARKFWDRTWRGGDLAVYRLGPKEAEFHIVGWTIASSPYVHHAMRGIADGMAELVCTRVHTRDVPAKNSGTSLVLHVAWV